MRSQSVISSAVLTVGYDNDRQLLKVRFRNGRTYLYLDVPGDVYQRLMESESIGKFVNEEIKPAYRAVKASS